MAGYLSHPYWFGAMLHELAGVVLIAAEHLTLPQKSAFPKSLLSPYKGTVRGYCASLGAQLCLGSLPWEMNGLRNCHRCLPGN